MNEGIKTVGGSGMRVFFDIHNVYDAQRFLRERGIEWDEIDRQVAHVSPYGEAIASPITYFRKGDFEIAYQVNGIGLAIFDKPGRRFR